MERVSLKSLKYWIVRGFVDRSSVGKMESLMLENHDCNEILSKVIANIHYYTATSFAPKKDAISFTGLVE